MALTGGLSMDRSSYGLENLIEGLAGAHGSSDFGLIELIISTDVL